MRLSTAAAAAAAAVTKDYVTVLRSVSAL